MFVLSAAASSPSRCRCHGCWAGAVISPQLELLELTGLIFLLTLDSCSHPLAVSAVVLVHVIVQVIGTQYFVLQCHKEFLLPSQVVTWYLFSSL